MSEVNPFKKGDRVRLDPELLQQDGVKVKGRSLRREGVIVGFGKFEGTEETARILWDGRKSADSWCICWLTQAKGGAA